MDSYTETKPRPKPSAHVESLGDGVRARSCRVPPGSPLHWPAWRRHLMYFSICLTSFAGINSALSNSAGLIVQAEIYEKPPVYLSYSLSAGLAGAAVGPFLWQPIAARTGKALVVFWASVSLIAFNIWAACCTGANDYGSFMASRVMGGISSSASGFLGGAIIVEIYRLESRGKAFSLWSFSLVFGTQIGPFLSGYIVYYTKWTVQYWYNVGLDVLVSICLFFFLEETETSADGAHVDLQGESWLKRRRYLIPGLGLERNHSVRQEIRKTMVVPWKILVCPNALIACFGLFIYFGFAAGFNNVLSILLQTPIEVGGYGLNPKQNSNFIFAQWVGVYLALAYGILVTDRLPLYLCKRNGGVWKPEYRLSPLWLPCLVLFPVGYLLIGLALDRHWPIAVLGFSGVLAAAASVMILPPLLSYLTECFLRYGSEANILGNLTRLAWGIVLPFFILHWVDAVGLSWTFGMIALFNLVCFIPIAILSFYGEAIRKHSLSSVSNNNIETIGGLGPAESKSAEMDATNIPISV